MFATPSVKSFAVKLNSETLYCAGFTVIYFLVYRVDAFSVLSRPVRQWSNKTPQYLFSKYHGLSGQTSWLALACPGKFPLSA